MAVSIHPTAIVEKGAELGVDVVVGAHAYVGSETRIGDRTRIHHHATVEGDTKMGVECEVFPYAMVGGKTHDLKYSGGRPCLVTGDRNVFREYSSIHLATNDGDATRLGSENLICAYSHIAHDCVVGDGLVMSSHSALAGHVEVEDNANIGWGVGVYQFCRVGTHAMIGACSKVVQDIPPYLLADGHPAVIRSINRVGLERAGFSENQVNRIKAAYRTLYREGLNRSQATEKLRALAEEGAREIADFLAFAEKSERGLAAGINGR